MPGWGEVERGEGRWVGEEGKGGRGGREESRGDGRGKEGEEKNSRLRKKQKRA